MSHQIVALVTREFADSVMQPTRSQALRRAEPMFTLSICHGMQTSERMHPKRVVVVKRESSVEGVMRSTRGDYSDKYPRHIIYTKRPSLLFDDASGGQLERSTIIWSCLSGKCTDGRLNGTCFLICCVSD